MIQSLRKKHFRLWIILPLLLVSGIICTAYLLPQEVIENSNLSIQDSSEGSLIYYHEYSEYILAIRKNNGSSNLQIEWTTKKPLKIPSANLYIASNNDTEDKSQWILLGSIGKKGTERFIIPFISKKRLMIELYDSIHNSRIRQFEIQL